MSICFHIDKYKVSATRFSEEIAFRLEPIEISDSLIVHYVYESHITNQTMPEKMQLLFEDV